MGRHRWISRGRGSRLLCAHLIAMGIATIAAREVCAAGGGDYFGVRVVDDQTGRPVPLVELETVHHVAWVTDSGGWAAICEPAFWGRRVFFHVRSHGYEFHKDGFGFAGVALEPVAGRRTTIRIKRKNIAERLYRVTGEGIYRDSVLLGESTPVERPLENGLVAGQDSVSGVVYQDRVFWFWGDTLRLAYPLGHYWMAGATSLLPGRGGLDPAKGINLSYFTDDQGFSRPVARMGVEKGPIWADAFLTLAAPSGRERLVCHYVHVESLDKVLDHGLAVFDDERSEFRRLKALDMNDRWCFPGQAHPLRHRDGATEYIYLGEVFANVRVRARWDDFLDPAKYEAFARLDAAGPAGDATPQPGGAGPARYAWKQGVKPVDSASERQSIAAGRLRADEAHFLPKNADGDDRVLVHRGSVRWNEHRKRWIMIAAQFGGTSQLGEIWYAEATEPTGPWRRAKKIVTHDRYSFYNPVHHPFLDQEGGRVIYFEGTYTRDFSGNPLATPRYDYNQIMYRLELDDPRLLAVR